MDQAVSELSSSHPWCAINSPPPCRVPQHGFSPDRSEGLQTSVNIDKWTRARMLPLVRKGASQAGGWKLTVSGVGTRITHCLYCHMMERLISLPRVNSRRRSIISVRLGLQEQKVQLNIRVTEWHFKRQTGQEPKRVRSVVSASRTSTPIYAHSTKQDSVRNSGTSTRSRGEHGHLSLRTGGSPF